MGADKAEPGCLACLCSGSSPVVKANRMAQDDRQLDLFSGPAEGETERPSLGRCGPQGSPVSGSLAREDYAIAMPDEEFERWVLQRLQRAAANPGADAQEREAIAADRKLRAWARDEGRARSEAQRAQLTAPSSASESPIEEMMLEAFFRSGFQRMPALSDVVVGRGPLGLLLQQLPVTSPVSTRYRLDFALIRPEAGVFLAIEVDGREFHDRTPEQARRDRDRDRKLTASGWVVIRFSGSEVWRDADRCAREVLDLVASERVPRLAAR